MIIHIGMTGADCREDLETAFARTGLPDALAHAAKVFVKPNFTYPRYTPGITTSPRFLEELLSLAGKSGPEVFVGESNGGYGSFLAEEAFIGHGLREICRKTNTTPIDLSRLESRVYTGSVAGKETSVTLPRFLVEDVDLTISVPVLKVHVMTTVSLSVKNLWGCCPLDLRLLQHAQLDRKLNLLAELCKAHLGIIDATDGLDKHGPMDGEARPVGKFIAGNDPYCLDWVTSKMMGFDPRAIRHLRFIAKETERAIDLNGVESNVSVAGIDWGFSLGFNLIDTLSFASFHNDALAQLIYHSPLTRRIFRLFGREPRRRLT